MPDLFQHIFKDWSQQHWLVWGFGLLSMLLCWIAIATGFYPIVLLPIALIVLYVGIVNFRALFYLLIICVPLSTEIVLPNGFGTDLPTEPLMIGLMLIGVLYFIQKGPKVDLSFLLHPISLLLLLHLFWIYVTTLSSNLFFVSLKFSLAKTWYLAVFYFLAAYLLKNLKQQKLFLWLLFVPLLFTVAVTMVRHAGYGFSFVGIHKVLHPFQRNHVNYAAMLAYVLPFVWFTWHRFPKWSRVWWFLLGSIALMVVAVYLSFTRAAYLALLIAVGTYFIFKWKLIRYALLGALVAVVIGAAYLVRHNQYLEYAPNYDRTVTHYEFDNLVEATYNLEDISTMERLYRWVAALNMSPEEPWVGFGPGNFINFYESYTLNTFRTYVSHNPERSGIHNYFLMILVDQGIIGLLLFLVFSAFLLIKGEQIYHQTQGQARKGVVMACLLALVVIYAFLIINDLLETDKVGSIYLVCIAILVQTDLYNQKELRAYSKIYP